MAVQRVQWQGAEASEETGEGTISVINDTGKRNVKVEIHATHVKLDQPVTGWLDTQNEPLTVLAHEAYRTGQPVRYTVVVHRLRNIDPSIPFDQLPTRSRVRDLVSLELVQNGQAPEPERATPPRQVAEAHPVQEGVGVASSVTAPTPSSGSVIDFQSEFERLSDLIDKGLAALRTAAREWADAEQEYRKQKAQAWLRITEGTAGQREAQVNAETAEIRHLRDIADGTRQAALESVRSRRAQMSALQTMAGALKAEAELARTAP